MSLTFMSRTRCDNAMADADDRVETRACADLTGTSVRRFAVRSRLGAGGMGEVYRADDPVLKRSVALKRLAPRFGADPRYVRHFLKEGERASALNHPHIAAVYDVLEESGEVFLVMEYVEGQTLRGRLKGPVTLDEFLEIGVQCAEALAAAHEKGISHGDIKPENIMLTPEGQVKVLDFGVARRLPRQDDNAATESVGAHTSSLGGTPAYMAPEALLGREPDGRADIFALGVVFYEMLAGRHPFLAAKATIDRILHAEPEPLRKINPAVPAGVERIVAGMLAKDPDHRYARAEGVLEDLRAVHRGSEPAFAPPTRRGFTRSRLAVLASFAAAALLAIAILIPSTRWKLERLLHVSPVPEQKELAVLPFSVVGASDPESRAFADGLTYALTAKLTQLTERHSLEVVPASLVRSHGVTSADQARQEFGVNLVLTGGLQRSGEMVRLTPTLIDARTHRQLRADLVTASLAEPFNVEDQVAASALSMLEIELRSEERPTFAAHGTTEPAAYDFYLQGQGYLLDYQKAENLESAIKVFNQALKLDPHYALAYAGRGEAYWYKYDTTKNEQWVSLPQEVETLVTQATADCRQAIALDAEQAAGHICLGLVDNGTGRYEEAVEQFRRAIDLEPTNDTAYVGLGAAYESLGKLSEAESTYRRAIELRPNYWAGYNWLGGFYYLYGRYADAVGMFRKVIALAPDSFMGYSNLGISYVSEGRYADAVPALEHSISIRPTVAAYSNLATAYFYRKQFAQAALMYQQALRLDDQNYIAWGNLGDAHAWAPGERDQSPAAYRKAIELVNQRLTVNPRDSSALGYLAWYYAALGEKTQALAQIKRALPLAPRDPQLLFNAALAYNQFGETEKTLEWLERAVEAGYSPATLRDTPNFDSLRANPRFQRLLGKAEPAKGGDHG